MFRNHSLPLAVGLLVCLFATSNAQEAATPAKTSSLQIAMHRFGLDVIDREIQNEIDTFHIGDIVYLWLRVEGGPADPITATWVSGDVHYDVELSIKGSPWRTWARKTLFRAGEWSVQVKDQHGTMLLERTLQVSETPRPDEE